MLTLSILLPNWNNLPLLRLCVASLRRHSAREHQLIVHANDGSDGTRDWLRAQGIEHTGRTVKPDGLFVRPGLADAGRDAPR